MLHAGVLLVLFALVFGLRPAAAQDGESIFDVERVQRATVFIIQAQDVGDDLITTCVGSGTVVSRSGLILTNAHNTVRSAACPGDTIIVGLSVRLDEPPVARYRAVVAQSNAGLDIALLRITRGIDGRAIDPTTLALPFVELADSNSLALDETISIVGYPGIGNDPVALVRGTISGILAEPSGGERAWIKTSTPIPGTMSGGGAYNGFGQLVGIPTTAPVGTTAAERACIWDTNGDELVNTEDACVPINETINAIRPSNFARPLLRAASLGLSVNTLTGSTTTTNTGSAPSFRRVFFAPAVNDGGMPTTVLRSLPAGSNSLYLFFDYANMTPETVYALRVTVDGIANPTVSLAPVRWGGGARGMWYLGSSSQPWANGVYEFTLFANGIAAETARLVIGGAPDNAPTFSDITFGLLDNQGNVLGNGFVLPTGSVANAEFLFRNMTDGTPWTAIWYYEGREISRTPPDTVWTQGANGTATASITDADGLLPGTYRLELYIQEQLAATSDFIIAGAQQGVFPQVFGDTHFTTATTPQEATRAAALRNFPSRTDAIYATFDWQQLAPGTQWTMRWLVDDAVFFERTAPWSGGQSGENFLMQLIAPGGVPDGSYQLDLFVGQVQLDSIDARVGIGQLPIDPFASASGVQVRGQILDADTGQGIAGASFVLISAEYSVEDFTWLDEQIYALATTDIDGSFELDRPLELSTEDVPVPYSALIVAEGYLPVSADGLEVTAETDNPHDLTIYMTRD